jgi:SAM-dependent methyltransferase
VTASRRFTTTVGRAIPDNVRPYIVAAYRPLLHRGTRVACPVCGHRFSGFLEHRGYPDVRCPLCGSMERHRLLWLWLRAETDFFEAPLRVLHFAPEFGIRRRLAKLENLEYRTTDLQSRMADENFDITSIPHPDASFDVVLCNHVLEHVPDDASAMRELRRIVRPGGWAVLMCPIAAGPSETLEDPSVQDPQRRLEVYGQEDHVRLYGADYADRLRSAGFEVEVVDYLSRLPESAVTLHKLRQNHLRFTDDVIHVGRVQG